MVKPGPTLLSRIFKHTSYVINAKRFDYPLVTQAVNIDFVINSDIIDIVIIDIIEFISD